MGVVVYGLLNGKFPFRDEKDISTKTVTVPKGTPQECLEFVLSILEKKEDKRADSSKMMADPWISGKVVAPNAGQADGDQEEFKPDTDAFAEGGANQGIADRRNELVERMQEGNVKKPKGASGPRLWRHGVSLVRDP